MDSRDRDTHHEALPVYCRREVAEVCLNCPRLSCRHGGGNKGCPAYREALARAKTSGNTFKVPPRRRRKQT